MLRTFRYAAVAAFFLCLQFVSGDRYDLARERASASSPCTEPANPVVAENCQPGNPASEWDIVGAGSAAIQGFATDISVDRAAAVAGVPLVQFKVSSNQAFQLRIYRLGYYGGNGARLIATVAGSALVQDVCVTDATTGLFDCGNWTANASWDGFETGVSTPAASGIYVAKAIRNGDLGASHIVFVIRDDLSQGKILFQTSDTTWQAYNQYGGSSLYTGGPGTVGRAYKVSYNRPFTTRAYAPQDWLFNSEYPMVRWLERNGYDVSYFTGVDSDRLGGEIAAHRVFLSVGHDEYWSAAQRANVEAARNAGVNLAFFSGNEVFWKTRWESSIAGTPTPMRTLVSYKETRANAKIDPSAEWTGTWRDARFSPPADGGRPENALTGTLFSVNDGTNGTSAIRVPEAEGNLRLWRNTEAEVLTSGHLTLPFGTLGYEWDEDIDNGARPTGLIRLSSTTLSVSERLVNEGTLFEPGTATHSLTLYRWAPSGALVFGAGSVQWTWGLDTVHDRADTIPGGAVESSTVQQATMNLLADMNVHPGSIATGSLAVTSGDTQAPTASVAAVGTVVAQQTVVITGSAFDQGGTVEPAGVRPGRVAGIEVSTDNGATWHPAAGRDTWSYAWTPTAAGATSVLARAIDDSGNIGAWSAPLAVTVQARACPCSIWGTNVVPVADTDPDTTAVELGVKFTSDEAGYITGLRFYKTAQNAGEHTGTLWTSAGAKLATAVFQNESASGWQTVLFSQAVRIDPGTVYVASYHTNAGRYAVSPQYFAGNSVINAPLRAPASGPGANGNGVFKYGPSAFPNESFEATNYWVDVIFDRTAPPDTTRPVVSLVSPVSDAIGIAVATSVTATFSEPMDGSSISATTFHLHAGTDPGETAAEVAVSVTYDGARLVATLAPNAQLAHQSTYTAVLKGGANGVKDVAGNTMLADYVWSFRTSDPPPPPPNEGPGGPILVLSSSAAPIGTYYAEILRTEGFNAFATASVTQLDAVLLASYDTVILGEGPLTGAQVTTITNWVTAGGNLIAMRPDKALAPLFGLTPETPAATVREAYLKIETSSAPGLGLPAETMQFHGIADRYLLNGATLVATLYESPTLSASRPAVTMRSVGTNGGHAVAFTFDLARSIVGIRQGNPAWSGQDRDGIAPTRSNDLFFGAAAADPQPDWVDLNKVGIPQADEQQRLLANVINHVTVAQRPMPRFWYLPFGHKAVVMMTGDDHANGGTAPRFDDYIAASQAGCAVGDWACIRGTSYVYATSTQEGLLPRSQAAAFASQGFEIALHVTSNCADWTRAQLEGFYTNQLAEFRARYGGAGGVPNPRTNRTHCVAWSDYATQADVELANGIRLDTNFYYWPPAWMNKRPGYFTGSALPMRFVRLDGTVIDVYQAVTQMTDESDQAYPETIDTLLEKALGPEGYYGVLVANMHTDFEVGPGAAGSAAIVASATARGVPVVTAVQVLDWFDAKNASSFGNIVWSNSKLTFSITAHSGARGLKGMVPAVTAAGRLTALTRGGTSVLTTLQTIKGVEYAFFDGLTGAYVADYAPDAAAPVLSNIDVATQPTAASVTWTTNEPATSLVEYGTAADSLTLAALSEGHTLGHGVALTGLNPAQTYFYRVISTDTSGNTAQSAVASFTTAALPPAPPATLIDTTVADFSAGSPGATAYIAQTANGEIILKPAVGAEFSTFPLDWFVEPWAAGGGAVASGGQLLVDAALVGKNGFFEPGRSLEFVTTFADAFQHVGFGTDFGAGPWAIFSSNGTEVFARTNSGAGDACPSEGPSCTRLGSGLFGSPHRYRIEWTSNGVVYFVDGTQVASHAIGITTAMRPLAASDLLPGGGALISDWFRMSPYADSASFVSRVLEASAGTANNWGRIFWTAVQPAGTGIAISVRTGNTLNPNDGTWTPFRAILASGGMVGDTSKYVQYRATLTTTAPGKTPELQQVAIEHGVGPQPGEATPPVITAVTATADETASAVITWTTDEAANSVVEYRRSPSAQLSASDAELVTSHRVVLTGLAAGATYTFEVKSTDFWGNTATSSTGTFTTPLQTYTDTLVAHFTQGQHVDTTVAAAGNGEVTLAFGVDSNFSGPAVPADWNNTAPWDAGGSVAVAGGQLVINGAAVGTTSAFGPEMSLEFEATFGAADFQHAGLATDRSFAPAFAIFSTRSSTDKLYARTTGGVPAVPDTQIDPTLITGSLIGVPHRYRIDWYADRVVFSIDGVQVASHETAIAGPMRPVASEFAVGGPSLAIDWLKVSARKPSGTFTSRTFDAGQPESWSHLTWTSDVPAGTTFAMSVSTGDTPTPDASWTTTTAPAPGASIGRTARYLRYQVALGTSDPALTPVLQDVTISGGSASGNVRPTANAQNVNVTEDQAKVFTLTGSDPEGTTLTFALTSNPAHGTLSGTAPNLVYTPAANYVGQDSFTFTVSDGELTSEAATVTITVTGVDDAPVAVDQTVITSEDAAITISLGPPADVDGQTLAYTAAAAAHGTVAINGASATYTPSADFNGEDRFTFTATDGSTPVTATVTVTVTPVNDDPVAVDDVVTVAEDSGASAVDVLANDSDGVDSGETLSVLAVTQGTNGTVAITGGGTGVSYTPNPNFHGTDTFTYTISDGNTGAATATVRVTITPVNDNPVAVDDATTVAEDSGATTINVLTNDGLGVDTGETLSVTAVTQSTNGTVAITTGGMSVIYTPNVNFQGTDTFTYTISDGNGGTATGTVTVTVTPVNDAPVANAGSLTVAEDTATAGTLTATDVDSATLTFSLVSDGTKGSVVITNATTGAYTYTPNLNATGPDSFTFAVSDGGAPVTAAIAVTITATDDAPVANAGSLTVAEDTATAGTLTATDVDSATLTFSIVTNGTQGTATITDASTGAYTYTPNLNATGPDSFTFAVSDGGAPVTAAIAVTITAVNDAPVLDPIGARSVAEGQQLTITPTGSDADGQSVSLGATGLPAGATFTGGVFNWTPAYDQSQPTAYNVTFTAADGTATTSEVVAITVTNTNRAPSITTPANQSTGEGFAVDVPVTASDPDGDTLTYTATGLPTGLSVNGSGHIVGTIASGAAAGSPYNVTVTAKDPSNATATTGVFTWTVTGAPKATTTALTSPTPSPTTYGTAIVLNATVTVTGGGTATGSVEFFDGARSLGIVPLTGGAASMSPTTISAGSPTVTAVYRPDGPFETSTGTLAPRTINTATASTSQTVSPLTQQYTDNETFQVTVTGAYGEAPAAGVNFKIGTQTMNTNGAVPFVYQGSGVWKATLTQQLLETVSGQLNPNGMAKIVSATLSGVSPNYTVSNPTNKSMTLNKEDATVAYDGPMNVVTSPAGGSTATIALRAIVTDIADGARGSVGKATVTFYNRDTNTAIATVAVTPDTADPSTGIATYNWNVNIGTATSKTYKVGFVVGSYYSRNNAADDRVITVTK